MLAKKDIGSSPKPSAYATQGVNVKRIKAALQKPCRKGRCRQNCNKNVSMPGLLRICQAYWSLRKDEQEYMIYTMASEREEDSEKQFTYQLDGSAVCFEAFCRFLGVGNKHMCKARRGMVDMRCKIDSKAMPKFKGDAQFAMVDRFFAETYQSAAEGLPDCSIHDEDWVNQEKNIEQLADAMGHFDTLRPELWQRLWMHVPGLPLRHLPPGRPHDLYLQFMAWHEQHQNSRPAASWSTFWRCWSTKWNRVLTFRKKSQHSRCNTCHDLERHLHSERGNLMKKLEWARRLRAHLREQYEDRTLYWSMRWASRVRMDVLVVIIDSMDKTKFAVPRFNYHRVPKWLDRAHRPRLTVTAGIAHGWCTSVWVADESLTHGAGAFLDVLFRLLEQVYDIAQRTGQQVPRHLWVQSDNTPAQAKNAETMLGLALLTARCKFDSVSLNFLPVGHTHEDVDQLFSLIAGHLCRQQTFEDAADVVKLIKVGLAEVIARKKEAWSVERLTSIRNFHKWLECIGSHAFNTMRSRGEVESARSFTFKLGMDLSTAESGMLPERPRDNSLMDVYCCVKGAMNHLDLLQAPVMILRAERLRQMTLQPLELIPRKALNKIEIDTLQKLAYRCEVDCGMSRAACYLRKLITGGDIDPRPPPTDWLILKHLRRRRPLLSTGNRHFNLLPDVQFWRLKVRFS